MQMAYSRFMAGLTKQNVCLNRKAISELAMTEPFSFKALVDQVRFMRGTPETEATGLVQSGKQ